MIKIICYYRFGELKSNIWFQNQSYLKYGIHFAAANKILMICYFWDFAVI